MQKLTFPLLILAFTFSACAQQSHLDNFYQQYHDTGADLGLDPNFLFSSSFGGNGSNDGHNDNGGNWSHKISAIRGMIINGKKTPNAAGEWSDLTRALRADHFEEWFAIRKGTGRVQL